MFHAPNICKLSLKIALFSRTVVFKSLKLNDLMLLYSV